METQQQQQQSWGRPSPLGTISLLLISYPFIRAIYNLYFHPLSKIPGPRTWAASRLPFIRSLLKGTLIQDIQKLHDQYGPILRIAPDEVTFAQPEAWNDILHPSSGIQQLLKNPIWWKHTSPTGAVSLINAIDPREHARIRKALAPGFTPRALRSQEPFIQRYVDLLVSRLCEQIVSTTPESSSLPPRVEIDIGPWLNFTTFDIFGDLGLGESFDCLQNSRYHPWISHLFNSVKAIIFISATRFYPVIEFILMRCIPPSLKESRQHHYQQIVDKVSRRLNYEMDRPDIMSHVIRNNNNNNSSSLLSIDEINISFMVLTTAGGETTATVLTGTMNYLIQNPEKLQLLVSEIRDKFKDTSEMTLDALRDLPYLNAVLSEGLRLCTSNPWILPRVVPPEGHTICGVRLPGGTSVSIQGYVMNRDSAYFYKPDCFLPERWLPETNTDEKSPFFKDRREAWQPFGVGPRSCIGVHLAWAQMRLILGKLVWNFDFEAPLETEKLLRWEELRVFLLVEKRPVFVRFGVRLDRNE